MGELPHLILIGMKHSGKSTLGKQLASLSKRLFIDTDTVIQDLTGKTARQIYDLGGSTLFIQKELEACHWIFQNQDYLIKDTPKNSISLPQGFCIATGGGLADNQEALHFLKTKGLLIYIDVEFEILYQRILESAKRDQRLPPFLDTEDPKASFKEIFNRRCKTYDTICHIRVASTNKEPIQIAKEILELIP